MDLGFIYIHGFNSSPQSFKARAFKDFLQSTAKPYPYRVPELSHWPFEAIADLRNEIEALAVDRPILLGSSLGGFYATHIVECYPDLNAQAVLINPAVRPYELLAAMLGENENIYTEERYLLTTEHLEQLLALEVESIQDYSRYLLLTQTGDETLDYRQGVDRFSQSAQWVEPGGSHGFEGFERTYDAIFGFARGENPRPTIARALGQSDRC